MASSQAGHGESPMRAELRSENAARPARARRRHRSDTRFLGNGHYRVHRAYELGVTHLPVTDNKLLSDFPVRHEVAVSYDRGRAAQLDVPDGSPGAAAEGPPRPTPPRRPGPGVTHRHQPPRGAS